MNDSNCGLKKQRIVIKQFVLDVIKLSTLQQRECLFSHHMLKEPNTKKDSGILILLLRFFSKEFKQVFPPLQVVLQNKIIVVGELIH